MLRKGKCTDDKAGITTPRSGRNRGDFRRLLPRRRSGAAGPIPGRNRARPGRRFATAAADPDSSPACSTSSCATMRLATAFADDAGLHPATIAAARQRSAARLGARRAVTLRAVPRASAAIAWRTSTAGRRAAGPAARRGSCAIRALPSLAIAHIDCDAFYATVEKRDNPELADKPVIIGGGKRGVVSTACYIARTFGVRSAMPMFKALDALPATPSSIRPDMAKYVARRPRGARTRCRR